jgi:hypothetical protein
MTTFAPTSQPNSDLPDAPHHHQHPPPPHLPHGAFAHQLNPPPSFTPNAPQVSRRASRDLRHHASNGAMAGPNGNGPMAVPGGRMANGNGHGGNAREIGFNGARSPPNNKSACTCTPIRCTALTATDTSHVPCKFYRQGACQAGKACPFLHSDEPITERAPCKYFTKVAHPPTFVRSLLTDRRATASLARNAPSPTFCPTATS